VARRPHASAGPRPKDRGRSTLVLELHDAGPIRIAGFARIGALSELAERLLAEKG
jgi:hypothetical protein